MNLKKKFFTVRELAEKLDVSRVTIYRLIRENLTEDDFVRNPIRIKSEGIEKVVNHFGYTIQND